MSSRLKDNSEFVARFIEIFRTDQSQKIAKRLGMTPSAIKNYLDGKRLPDTYTLMLISDITDCSIDWLLKGKGKKYLDDSSNTKLLKFANNFTKNLELELIDEINGTFDQFRSKKRHTSTDSPKMVKLSPDKVRQEKITEEETSDLPSNPS